MRITLRGNQILAGTVCLILGFGPLLKTARSQVGQGYAEGGHVPVRVIPHINQFREDNHWVSLLASESGRVYVGLTCHGCAAGFYEYDPVADQMAPVARMDDATGEHTPHLEPHSKIHAQIREDSQGRIWFGSDMGTHFYGQKWDVPDGYPGGHLFCFDPQSRELTDLGIPFPRASIRVLEMDRKRERLYIVTFPDGRFYTYDMITRRTSFKGRVNNNDAIARALAMDDRGNVYGSFNPYGVFRYSPEKDLLEDLPVTLPHREPWCDKGHYRREHVWRKAVWHPRERVLYGLDEGSATLFRFDPATNEIKDLGQLTTYPLNGQRIVPSTSYAFAWHERSGKFIYTAPADRTGNRYAASHLVTYDPETGKKVDHGPMKDPESGAIPYYTEGISIDPQGTVYVCGKVKLPGTGENEPAVLGLIIIDPEFL